MVILNSKDGKRKAEDKLEALLLEEFGSDDSEEMTQQD